VIANFIYCPEKVTKGILKSPRHIECTYRALLGVYPMVSTKSRRYLLQRQVLKSIEAMI
jgi:hypothetical protein